jgi:Fe2+ transport system protein FeoA
MQARKFPLSLSSEREWVTIVSMRKGRKFQERLISMGLAVGDVIEVIQRHGQGTLVVEKDNNRYVLGGGMARKIEVTLN